MHDPGTFLPTGRRCASAGIPGRDQGDRAANRAMVSIAARSTSAQGSPIRRRRPEKSCSRCSASPVNIACPVHVHTRRGMRRLRRSARSRLETNAPLHVVHVNSAGVARRARCSQMIDRARARGHGCHDRGLSVHGRDDGDPVREPGRATRTRPPSGWRSSEWPSTGERLTAETFEKYRADRRPGRPAHQHGGNGRASRSTARSR